MINIGGLVCTKLSIFNDEFVLANTVANINDLLLSEKKKRKLINDYREKLFDRHIICLIKEMF